MADNFKYSLELDTAQAQSRFDKLVKQMEQKLGVVEKAVAKSIKLKDPKKSVINVDAAAAEKAINQIERKFNTAARGMGKNLQKELSDSFAAVKSMKDNGFSASEIRDFADDELYRIKEVSKERKKASQERIRDEKREADRVRAIDEGLKATQTRGIAAVTAARNIDAKQRASLEAFVYAEMKALALRTTNMKRQQFQAEVQAFQAAVRQRINYAKAEYNATYQASQRNAARMGKLTMGAFQVQQIIEDVQFAGFRGIGNNLAFLATMMGGPTGIIALAGLAAYQIYDFSQQTDKAAEAAKNAADSEMAYGKAIQFRIAMQEGVFSDARVGVDQDIVSLIAEKQLELEALQTKIAQRGGRRAIDLSRNLEASIRDSTDRQQQMGSVLEGTQTFVQMIDALEQEVAWFWQSPSRYIFKMWSEDFKGMSKYVDQNRKSLKSLSDEMRTAYMGIDPSEEFRTQTANLIEQEQIQRRILSVLQEQAKWREKITKLSDIPRELNPLDDPAKGPSEAYQRRVEQERNAFSKFVERILKRSEPQIKQLEQRLAGLFAALQKNVTPEEEAAIRTRIRDTEEQIQKLYEEQSKEITFAKKAAEDRLDADRQHKNLLESILSTQQDVESNLESQIERTKSLIEAEKQRAFLLQMSRRSSQVGFGGMEMQAQSQIVDAQAQKVIAAINKQANAAKAAAEWQFQFFQPGKDIAFAQIEAKQAALVAKVEAEAKARQQALLRQRIKELQKEVNLELTKASQAQTNKEFEVADQRLQRAKQLLEEVRSLQLGSIGSDPVQGANALADAQKTQASIQSVFDKQMELSKAQKQQEENHLNVLNAELLKAQTLKIELEAADAIKRVEVDRATMIRLELERMLALKQQIVQLQAIGEGPAGAQGVIPGRASGGPVLGSQPYFVGEQGMELFVPSVSGRILNHQDTKNFLARSYGPSGSNPNTGGGVSQGSVHIGNVTIGSAPGVTLQEVLRQASRMAASGRIRQS